MPTKPIAIACKEMKLESSLLKVQALDSKANPPEVEASMAWVPPHCLVGKLALHYSQHMENIFGFSKSKSFWLGIKPDDPRLCGSPICEALKEEGGEIVPRWLHEMVLNTAPMTAC